MKMEQKKGVEKELKELKEKLEKEKESKSYSNLFGATISSLLTSVALFYSVHIMKKSTEGLEGSAFLDKIIFWFNTAAWILALATFLLILVLVFKKYKIHKKIWYKK